MCQKSHLPIYNLGNSVHQKQKSCKTQPEVKDLSVDLSLVFPATRIEVEYLETSETDCEKKKTKNNRMNSNH